MVVSVDEDKGYINLSKKRVAAEDIPPKQELYHKAKAAPVDSTSWASLAACSFLGAFGERGRFLAEPSQNQKATPS